MKKRIDLTGKKFGRLKVLRFAFVKDCAYWECICDCGNVVNVRGCCLTTGHTQSCGCLQKEKAAKNNINNNVTHGMTKTRIYKRWTGIKNRCQNPHSKDYKNYGGRGISVCDEWQEFIPFYDWAVSNGYRDDLTIDRIDVNGNYEPSNCRWVTTKEQNGNKSDTHHISYKGETLTIPLWCEKFGLNYQTMVSRLHRGWSMERIESTPARRSKNGNISPPLSN